jgi:hypothetical protein
MNDGEPLSRSPATKAARKTGVEGLGVRNATIAVHHHLCSAPADSCPAMARIQSESE